MRTSSTINKTVCTVDWSKAECWELLTIVIIILLNPSS